MDFWFVFWLVALHHSRDSEGDFEKITGQDFHFSLIVVECVLQGQVLGGLFFGLHLLFALWFWVCLVVVVVVDRYFLCCL
jgi:hypothetical protein